MDLDLFWIGFCVETKDFHLIFMDLDLYGLVLELF